ncbi:hypothetical protein GX51_03753 [Blastomyces parvus]|uniref:SET domain-containing protein n=1 Tax=Blastomyces parvus TaxID=2060905 RepID=A0A2B7X591_9EURO|nr:hypothetical protein GX51_03753 [Blastomyces parvus]
MTWFVDRKPTHQLEKFARVALEAKDTIFLPPPSHPPPPHPPHQNSIAQPPRPIEGSLLERQQRVLEEVRCQIMTDTSSLAATHSTANSLPVTVQPLPSPVVPSPVPNGNNNAVAPQHQQQPVHDDEDEPYTIKCICSFEDDDGHTVFCERCETWQHILCYYDGEDVPEVHNCADCEPRPLNSKLATELQRRRREEQSDGGDRKSKRSGSKSHKKKAAAKDSNNNNSNNNSTGTGTLATGSGGDQTNGWSSHERGPPPAKKSKTSHRSSNSISSLTGLAPSLGSDSRRRATSASAMSPTKASSLIPNIPLYSQEFLHLYDHDQANVDIPSNLFDNLQLATDFSSWLQDPARLARDANGRSPKEVFTYLDRPLDPAQWPVLSKQVVTDSSVEYDGRHPTWRFLTVENDVHKDEIIGEVKGKVGHFRDYCLDPNNRWHEFHHPVPFVFFHPQLPIYIDSRKEGSQLRYVRRSCHPNVTMKTVITNNIEYHFCLVANQDISAKSEITTSWYLDPQMFPSNNSLVKQEGSNDGISDDWPISISKVLANFGGCACDSSRSCRLAKVDCRRPPKSADAASKQVNGRRKKSKAKNAISPVNTGLSNSSRAASEAVKAQVDDDQGGSRSRSTSNRPRSRDLTPTAHSPSASDPLALLPGELSAREKRKIAAAEKKFEQLEHEQQQPQKKKKRSSGASVAGTSTTTAAGTTTTTGVASQTNPKPLRIDTGNARRSSNSPRKRSPASVTPGPKSQSSQKKVSRSNTPVVASPLRRPHYVDSETQTEPDENDPDFIPPKPPRRSGFVPLTTRLLKRCHEDRLRLQQNASPVFSSDITTPSIPDSQHAIISSPLSRREDVDMKDVDTPMTPPTIPHHTTPSTTTTVTTTIPPSPGTSTALSSLHISSDPSPQNPPHPLPSTVAHNFPMPRKPPDRARAAELRVQLPPPAPPPSTTPSSTPISTTTTTPAHPTASTNTNTNTDQPNPPTPIPPTQPSHSFPMKLSPTSTTTPTTTPTTTHHPPVPAPVPVSATPPPPSAIAPSPVKKKLSLGDYMSRRGTLTATATATATGTGTGTATTPTIEKPQPPLFSAGQSQSLSLSPSTAQQQQQQQQQGTSQNSADNDKNKIMPSTSVDGRGASLAGGSDSDNTTMAQDVIMQDAGADTSSVIGGGGGGGDVGVGSMLESPSSSTATGTATAAPVSSSTESESRGGDGNNGNGYNNSNGAGVGVGSGGGGAGSRDPRLQHQQHGK